MTEIERKLGLTPEEHGRLNQPAEVFPGGQEARDVYMAELKKLYEGDSEAQQRIEYYDPSSEHHKIYQRFREAILSGDEKLAEELMLLARELYPDLYPE